MSTGQTPPELTIPIGMDLAEVQKNLAKLKELLAQAGQAGVEGFGKAESAAVDLGSALGEALSHQGYQIAKDIGGALKEGLRESAEYAREVTKEFTTYRAFLQEVAALKGQDNTGSFTTDQARAASSAGLKPDEWVKFQSAFQSVAGAYIEGPGAKMNGGQAEDYQKQLAQFARAKGVGAEQIAELGGSILQFSEGPLSVDEAMARAGRAFRTLERARTAPKDLLKGMTGIMAQGANADEAAQLLNIMGEVKPGEEETYVTNALKALDETIIKGRGSELGITDEMSPLEKIRTATETLASRAANGENLNEMLKDYANDLRERRGLGGLVRRGVQEGGWDRVAGYTNTTPADYASSAIDRYAASDAGRQAQAEADLARARIERGYRSQEVLRARTEAEAQLTREGRFENMNTLGDAGRRLWASVPFVGSGVSNKDQLINERATAIAFQQLYTSGGNVAGMGQAMQTGAGLNQFDANENLLDLLKRIEANTAKSAVGQGGPGGGRPLNAQPPNPRTRP